MSEVLLGQMGTLFLQPSLRGCIKIAKREQTISHVQVGPPSPVCPARRAAACSPDEQLSASKPCGGRQRRQRKAEEGNITYRYPAAPASPGR